MDVDGRVVHIERVCCLECGTNYLKPCGGAAAAQRNPGCPSCGYLGWISAVVPVVDAATPAQPRRSGGDPPRSSASQSR
jgi:hypothetical protein